MHEEMKGNWIKIGLISLTVLMFFSVFRAEAENTNQSDSTNLGPCMSEEIVVENLDYISRGIDIWNNSNTRNEVLLDSILNLMLASGFEDGCLYVVTEGEAERLRISLEEAGLSKIQMVNGLIKRLNNSGYVSPIPTLVDLEI